MAILVGATLEGGGVGSHLALDIPAAVLSLALIAFLRRWPVPVAVLLCALAAVSPVATPPTTLAALVIARWRPLPVALAVAGAGIGAHLIRGAWRPVAGLPYGWWAVLVCVAYAALVGWGMLLRANQALISSLRDRAERAEADQARRVAEARAAERTRIAREMHDVLAHRLSLLATYAGALAYRPDAPPEQMSRAAEVIRSGAHQALDELREVIGVLRDDELPGRPDGQADGMRPLPGAADLPRLIEESRAAGMVIEVGGGAWQEGGPAADEAAVVDVTPCGLLSPLPDAVGRTAYRVVQEGLTNVRKHAPGAAARITLDGGPGAGLDVTIANRMAPARPGAGGPAAGGPASGARAPAVPGSGTGLIGLSERLELAGGTLESGARGGEFQLRARLPWPE